MAVSLIPDQFSNFALSTLAGSTAGGGADLGSTDTVAILATGDGAIFPPSFPFMAVMGPNVATPELIKVTGRSGDICTIVRGQEGTLAQHWPIGTIIQHTVTAGNLNNLWNALNTVNTSALGNSLIVTNSTPQNTVFRTRPTGYSNDSVQIIDDGTTKIRVNNNSDVLTDVLLILPHVAGLSQNFSATFHGTADLASNLPSGAKWQTATANIGGAYTDDAGNTRTILAPSVPGGTARAQAIASTDTSGTKHVGMVVNTDGSVTVLGNLTVNGTANFGSSSATLILSGESTPTAMVRSLPSGYSTYTVNIVDTGQFEIRAISNNILTDMIVVTPGGASTPATALFHGTADMVPAAGIQAGTLPSSVNIPLSSIPVPFQIQSGGSQSLIVGMPTAVPGATLSVIQAKILNDAAGRTSMDIRNDGWGQFSAGTGNGRTAHMHATSTGWTMDESLVVAANLTVNGSLILPGAIALGTTVTGALTTKVGVGQTNFNFGDAARTTDTPTMYWHAAGSANTYDVALQVTGGSAGNDAQGILTVYGGLRVFGSTVWHQGNDGAGSGLDADLLDGINSAGYLQVSSSNAPVTLVISGSQPGGTITGRLWLDLSVSLP